MRLFSLTFPSLDPFFLLKLKKVSLLNNIGISKIVFTILTTVDSYKAILISSSETSSSLFIFLYYN